MAHACKPIYFQWLEKDFLGYLKEWDDSVGERQGDFTIAERKKMCISEETLDGLRMTGIPLYCLCR